MPVIAHLFSWISSILRRAAGLLQRRPPEIGPPDDDYRILEDDTIEQLRRLHDPKAAPLVSIPAVLNKLFDNPHNKILPLQVQATEILFEKVGAAYVPGRVIGLLRKMDALQASACFLQAVGFNYEELLRSASERDVFTEALEFLVEIDGYRVGSTLSEQPIYRAIRERRLLDLPLLVERYRKATTVSRLEAKEHPLPRFRDFARMARGQLENWDLDGGLDELYDKHERWSRFLHDYAPIRADINDLFRQAEPVVAQDQKARSRMETLRRELVAAESVLDLGDSLTDLEDLLARLRSLHEEFQRRDEQRRRRDSGPRPKNSREFRAWSIEQLLAALEYPASGPRDEHSIRKAYRRMAKEHHPRAENDPDYLLKEEKMKEINVIYNAIMDRLFGHTATT